MSVEESTIKEKPKPGKFQPNPTIYFQDLAFTQKGWPEKNTALLIVHGIGNQLPLESIDLFGRGLIRSLKEKFGEKIKVSHHVVPKDDGNASFWMDNVLRLELEGNNNVVDLYEYYWAHYTENKASWTDINTWLQGVIKGAKTFYKRNGAIGKEYKDRSIFFDDKDGKFNVATYWLFVSFASKVIFIVDGLVSGLLWLVERVPLPLFGTIGKWLINKYTKTIFSKMTNVVGDVVIYNVVDPKHKFYQTRKAILDGAVKALRFLVERTTDNTASSADQKLFYGSVIVGGHSLGSQVAYDAINRFNLLVNQGKISHYNREGVCELPSRGHTCICDQLNGFFTFGSPLDKIVFFLRENVGDKQYVRQQLLAHFHGFKQREYNFSKKTLNNSQYVEIENELVRFLDDIEWRNYFDNSDYVSGGLDYYHKLINIDCKFEKGFFTHSNYWESKLFYDDVIYHFILSDITDEEVKEKVNEIAGKKKGD
jgi:hypothetical protein